MRFIAVVSASLVVAACSSKPTQGGGGSGSAGSAAVGSAAGAAGSGSAAAPAGGGSQAAAPAAKPGSTLAQVQAGAPSGAKVVPAEIAVTGVDLFQVSDAKPLPDDEGLPPKLVGVVGGAGGEVVEGRPLLRAVIA